MNDTMWGVSALVLVFFTFLCWLMMCSALAFYFFEIWEMTMKIFFLLLPPFLSCFFLCLIPLHGAVFRLHGNGVVESGTVTRWTRPCWASISFQWEMVFDGACNNVYRISELGTGFFFFNASRNHFP